MPLREKDDVAKELKMTKQHSNKLKKTLHHAYSRRQIAKIQHEGFAPISQP